MRKPRSSSQSLRWLLALLAILALGLAACADDAPEAEEEEEEAEAADEEPAEPEEPDEDADEVADGADCEGLRIGIAGPFTGDAASIGQEQLNWAEYAVERFNDAHGTSYELVQADTQLDPAQATTVAQQFVSDDSMLAVVGPAGSPEAEAVGPIFEPESMAYIGMSVTRPTLTDGSYPTFFRPIPNDDHQAPTIAGFIADDIGAEGVFIIDDQSSYSVGLADAVESALDDQGLDVARDSVPQDQTDYSALVSSIGDDTDVVFLPWQLAANAQLFSQQMEEQGRDAIIFGSDGLFSPADFTADGAYVTSFAPDITGLPQHDDLVAGYEERFGEFQTTYGPPTYLATELALTAVHQACEAGEPTREAVLAAMPDVTIPDSVLGHDFAFDDSGDVLDARFFIFRIEGGEYILVE